MKNNEDTDIEDIDIEDIDIEDIDIEDIDIEDIDIEDINIEDINGITSFEKLKPSTMTVMVYSNVTFNKKEIFDNLNITKIDYELTKKKKNINKKRVTAPYGAIIGARYGILVRGIPSKRKKFWCPICQPLNEKGKKVPTVCGYEYPYGDDDIRKIHFKCLRCSKIVYVDKLQKIVSFLNQLTLVISLGDLIVNVMIFNDNCKIAGNKSMEHAMETIMMLWENYIQPYSDAWKFSRKSDKDVHFLFELVMKNLGFKLGFAIDKYELNMLMNEPRLKNFVHLSTYESTSSTNVNIKMISKRPENFAYNVLVYGDGGNNNPYIVTCKEKLYARKKTESKFVTFIVFSSSETILTGRYDENMKYYYEFFTNTIIQNRDQIAEIINRPKISLLNYLESVEQHKKII